jgi:outer membrane murein-binding lipoprotein Lpp
MVMKALLTMVLGAALLSGTAHADCTYPSAPAKLPDGASATLEDMVAGQKAVKDYDKSIKEYVDCIDKELEEKIAKGGDKLKPEQKTDMQKVEAQKHNAAIDQLQNVADRFNEQVKVFKARNADKKG